MHDTESTVRTVTNPMRQRGANRPAKSGGLTIHDVAREARVSVTTVSNLLNRRFHMMSATTRARIESVIDELGYHPSAAGRELRLRKRFSIGLIVVNPEPAFLVDPFITEVAAGMSNLVSDNDYGLVIHGCPIERLETSFLMKGSEVDALAVIVSGSVGERTRAAASLSKARLPLLFIQEANPPTALDACIVRQDDMDGGRMIALHLLERGARRFALLGPDESWYAIEQRIRGVRETLAAHPEPGIEFSVIECHEADFADARTQLEHYIADNPLPDAIIGANDQLAIAASQVIRRRGLSIPDDVQITGFNGFQLRQYSEPLLTSVASPAYAMGKAGGRALIDRLNTGKFEMREMVFPVEFLPGASTKASS